MFLFLRLQIRWRMKGNRLSPPPAPGYILGGLPSSWPMGYSRRRRRRATATASVCHRRICPNYTYSTSNYYLQADAHLYGPAGADLHAGVMRSSVPAPQRLLNDGGLQGRLTAPLAMALRQLHT